MLKSKSKIIYFFYLILNVLYGSYYKTRFSKCQYVFQNLFLKTFFHIYLGEIFLALLHVLSPLYIPRDFFVFTTRDPTLIVRIFTFFRTIHTNEFLCICKNHARKSEFPECGNLYNYLQTLGTQFAYRYI
jgi:hypothetical protein